MPCTFPHKIYMVSRIRWPYKLRGSYLYRGADKSLARPGRKQATAKEDFEFHISYLQS
jgi:hypothetical protein